MYSGLQPAMTPLMAIFSTLACAHLGGTAPIISWGARFVAASIALTRSSVGGMIGKPSPHPFSSKKACAAQRSSGISKRSACSAAVVIGLFLHASDAGLLASTRKNPLNVLPRRRCIPRFDVMLLLRLG